MLPAQPQEATAEFLFKTLVLRRALRSRNDVSYVTLRSWRQPIREHQISALKALKRHAPDSISGEIAAEIADDVRSLFGGGGFTAVVPMPCGHSVRGRCLSPVIARGVGAALGLPVAHALALPVERGGSHPKANARRAAMQLIAPIEGPVLLVDDVATSGRHIEEATRLLRAKGANVLAVAWIGGDAEKGD
jgi:predicted amidophosphoribosyltransferase